MDIEYRDDTSRRGKWIIVIGLFLAVGAGIGAFVLLRNAEQQASHAGLQTVPVVVAARDIAARKPLEEADLVVREVPLDETNERGVFSDPLKVTGLVPSVPVLAGQPIYANILAADAVAGGQFSILAPGEVPTEDSEAWRAVSITVPDDRAVGGLIGANDTVDVYMTVTVQVPTGAAEAGQYYTDKSTKITYQNVVVLAKATTFYVLKVHGQVAEEINHLQASGAAAFSLALRPPVDTRMQDASKLGETTNLLIERYGLPIPQIPAGFGAVNPPPVDVSPAEVAPADSESNATASPGGS